MSLIYLVIIASLKKIREPIFNKKPRSDLDFVQRFGFATIQFLIKKKSRSCNK